MQVDAWEDCDHVQAKTTAGAIFIGSRRDAEFLWHGLKGQSLVRTSLPYPLVCWTAVADTVLVGIADNGTVHVLHNKEGKWTGHDYHADFMEGANLVVEFIGRQKLVVAHNGAESAAIELDSRGKLGALAEVDLPVVFDTPDGLIGTTGFAMGRRADGTVVGGQHKEFVIGSTKPESEVPYAMATESGDFAWVSERNRLHAGVFKAQGVVCTSPAHSVALEDEAPNGMSWSPDGAVLLVTFPSKRWAWCRRFGFQR